MSVIWGKIGQGSERGAMSAIDPLTDIQVVADGDFGDLGISARFMAILTDRGHQSNFRCCPGFDS